MNEKEIREFFNIKGKEEESFSQILQKCVKDDEFASEDVIFEVLKKSFGYPISFMDQGKEELFYLDEKKSDLVYQKYAQEVNAGYYEDLYDFVQEFSDYLGNCPEAD